LFLVKMGRIVLMHKCRSRHWEQTLRSSRKATLVVKVVHGEGRLLGM